MSSRSRANSPTVPLSGGQRIVSKSVRLSSARPLKSAWWMLQLRSPTKNVGCDPVGENRVEPSRHGNSYRQTLQVPSRRFRTTTGASLPNRHKTCWSLSRLECNGRCRLACPRTPTTFCFRLPLEVGICSSCLRGGLCTLGLRKRRLSPLRARRKVA